MADPLGDEFDAAEAAGAASASSSGAAANMVVSSTPEPTTHTDASPVASPATPPDPANPAVQAAATPAAPAAGAPSAQATEPTYTGARDFVAKALGFSQAGTYGDDAAFLTALVEGHKTAQQQLQQLQQLSQYGQMYLNERSQAQRTQQPAQAQPDPLAAYKAPEFNPAWQNAVERTETGGYKLRDGADPAILPKFLAYQQYRADIGERFLSDPAAFVAPLIDARATEIAKKAIAEQFGQQESTTYVNNFMEKNASWLYQSDQAGNVVRNAHTGNPIISPAGQRFYQHLKSAENLGITNSKAQEQYARALLMADLSRPQQQTQTAVANGDAAKAALLAKMNRNPNASGSFVGPDNTGHTAPASSQEGLSLNDRLRNALSKFSDADIGV